MTEKRKKHIDADASSVEMLSPVLQNLASQAALLIRNEVQEAVNGLTSDPKSYVKGKIKGGRKIVAKVFKMLANYPVEDESNVNIIDFMNIILEKTDLRIYNSRQVAKYLYDSYLNSKERELAKGIRDGELPPPVLYTDNSWENVSKSSGYTSKESGMKLIKNNFDRILEIINPKGKPYVKIWDLGVGDCEKGYQLCELADKAGLVTDYMPVDDSMPVLYKAIRKFAINLAHELIEDVPDENSEQPTDSEELKRKNRWSKIKELLSGREISNNEIDLDSNLDRIIARFSKQEWIEHEKARKSKETPNPRNPQLLLYMLARIFSLHTSYKQQRHPELIKALDKTRPPLSIFPVQKNLNDLTPDDFKSHGNQPTLIADLGGRVGNNDLDEGLEYHRSILRANPNAHSLIGFQPRNFDKGEDGFEEEAEQLKASYLTDEMLAFVLSPFKKFPLYEKTSSTGDDSVLDEADKIKFDFLVVENGHSYADPEKFAAKVWVDFEPDPKRPDIYRIIHKMKFLKDVRYSDGRSVRRTKKDEIDEIAVHYSLKPKLGQMMQKFGEHGLKIEAVFIDKDENTGNVKYAKLLVRAMTYKEIERWEKNRKQQRIP